MMNVTITLSVELPSAKYDIHGKSITILKLISHIIYNNVHILLKIIQ